MCLGGLESCRLFHKPHLPFHSSQNIGIRNLYVFLLSLFTSVHKLLFIVGAQMLQSERRKRLSLFPMPYMWSSNLNGSRVCHTSEYEGSKA